VTEAEWLAATDFDQIWDALVARATLRKSRLFRCAECRRSWHLLSKRSRSAVEIAERYADGLSGPEDLVAAEAAALRGGVPDRWTPKDLARLRVIAAAMSDEHHQATWGSVSIKSRGPDTQPTPEVWSRLELLRDLIGNPFQSATRDPVWLTWNTGTVLRLAGQAYDERQLPAGTLDPYRLGLIADALEDAGCTDPDLLGHLRGPGPHVRGCWAVDLVLGKS
jgi:hypothetical protein